jgi:hypothetical protein
MVPAAVIIMGNIFGSALAAIRTASYPAMLAMDESASMVWARVMRGTSSMAKKETPAPARSAHSRSDVSGSPKPMRIWPARSSAMSRCP